MIECKKISKCRLCKSTKIIKIINFNKVPIGNNLANSFKLSLNAKKFPLLLNQCIDCKHFQLGHSVSDKILYQKNYTYLSGISPVFIDHFDKYALWISKYFKNNNYKKLKVIDVGSNDGTCLNSFKNLGFKVLGVDPAKLPADIANKKNINTINKFFNDQTKNFIIKNYGLFDLVTSHNVLAHVDNLKSIFLNVFNVLKYNGFFCFEVGYFYSVIKNNYFDTIYHEHLDYHHAYPLVKFLNNTGFYVINVSTNTIQGGTIRLLCKKNSIVSNNKQVLNFIKNESKSILNDQKYLNNWKKNIDLNMNNFSNIVKRFKKENKIIVGFGAPTKAVLLLNTAKLNNKYLDYIIDDNKLKQNKYLPILGIPIYSKEMLHKVKPDVIIILAWNFADDILKQLRKEFKDNIKIVIPLPKQRIINI